MDNPTCDVICSDGFIDADQDPINGCECVFSSEIDPPFDGSDADCDGDDGDHEDAIHVSKSGLDSNDGSLNAPMLTLQAAIDQAQADGKSYVLVAEGVYDEHCSGRGIKYYGSMNEAFTERDVNLYTRQS